VPATLFSFNLSENGVNPCPNGCNFHHTAVGKKGSARLLANHKLEKRPPWVVVPFFLPPVPEFSSPGRRPTVPKGAWAEIGLPAAPNPLPASIPLRYTLHFFPFRPHRLLPLVYPPTQGFPPLTCPRKENSLGCGPIRRYWTFVARVPLRDGQDRPPNQKTEPTTTRLPPNTRVPPTCCQRTPVRVRNPSDREAEE